MNNFPMVADKDSPFAGSKVGSVIWTVGTETSNIIKVTAQIKTAQYETPAARVRVSAWLSDASTGDGLSAAPPDGGLAIAAYGNLHPKSPVGLYSLITAAGLAIHSTPEQFKTTVLAVYTSGGLVKTKAITTALTFTAAHVVTASKFAVILVQINAAGTISTKVPSSTQAYNSAPLALAALPTPDAGNTALGYIAIAAKAATWTANTDDLTNGSDLTTATFNDMSVVTTVPLSFDLTTNATGKADINITHAAGAKTLYVCIALPSGEIAVSPAVTFA